MHMSHSPGRPSASPLPEWAGRGAEWAGRGAEFAVSGVAAPPTPAPARRGGRINLGSLASVLTLAGLIGGLGYGAYALLLDLQRVGFAPHSLTPEVFAMAPSLTAPALDWKQASEASLPGYEWEGAQLAAAVAGLQARDGPISAIDPATSGHFSPRHAAAVQSPQVPLRDASAPDGPHGGIRITLSPDGAAPAEPQLAADRVAAARVVLHATDETWIRVRDGETVIFEGVLQPGDQYEVPRRATAPLLRTGNAGALFALLDGAPYGPIGSSSVVLRSMSLRAGDIAGQAPEANHWALTPGSGGETLRRVDLIVTQ